MSKMSNFTGRLNPEEQAALDSLVETFEHYKNLLEECDYTRNEDEYFEIMSNLWNFRSNYDDEWTCWLFERTEFYQKYRDFFIAHEQYYMRALEGIKSICAMTKMAEAAKNGDVYSLVHGDYTRESFNHTHEELKILNTQNCSELVMVGCGPYPETLLYLHNNIESPQLIGLDENHEAIYMAGKMLSTQHLDRITLLQARGQDYDYSGADIVYIANFVLSKKETLDRIVETAPDHVQIIVRCPQRLGRLSYEDPKQNLNSRLYKAKETPTNKFFLYNALLFKKFSL